MRRCWKWLLELSALVQPVQLACIGIALGAALLGMPHPVRADPHSGLGLFGGLAFHKGDVQVATGEVSGFLSSGLDGGVEYQHVLSPEFSLVGFAQTSAESVEGDAGKIYTAVSHSILGGEIRYWDGAKFVGFHAGSFSELLLAKHGSGASDTSGNGWGVGFTGGWEGDSGWFAAGQVDLAEIAYTNATHGLTGIRIHIGYRWRRKG